MGGIFAAISHACFGEIFFIFLIKQMDCSAQAQLSFSYSRAAAQWQLLTEENVSRYTRPDFPSKTDTLLFV